MLASILILACSPRESSESRKPPTTSNKAAPGFDGQRAFAHVIKLTQLGHRYYAAPRRDEALDLLENTLEGLGAETSRQVFSVVEPRSGVRYELTNVIGRINPDAKRRILLGSHYDTRLWAEEDADETRHHEPIVGANDGTSGVAVLFEVLRVANADPSLLGDVGLDIVLFDGEEFGRPGSNDYCQGSRHFASKLDALYPAGLPEAAMILDMVGDRDLAFQRERHSQRFAAELNDTLWRVGQSMAPGVFKDGLMGPIIDDHTYLRRAGIPAILLIDYEYPHWHTHQDTIDKVSPASLSVTGNVLVETLRELVKAS